MFIWLLHYQHAVKGAVVIVLLKDVILRLCYLDYCCIYFFLKQYS